MFFLGWFAGCSQSGDSSNAGSNSSSPGNKGSSLTAFEKKHGIGPVTEPMKLAELSPKRAAKGEEIFTMNCSSCHKMDERYVGPAQRDVVDQRTPEYIMNMKELLNFIADVRGEEPVHKDRLIYEFWTAI